MTYNLFPKVGIPVLAYPTSDEASQWPCSLVIKYCEARMQATISLQSELSVQDFDNKQTFTLLYNADNLMNGSTSLGPATIPLPQARLAQLARKGNAQMRTLFLTLKTPCAIRCPRSSGSIALDPPFPQFVSLAKATKVSILFDYNWLHQSNVERFQRLVSHPETLTGFPVDNIHAKLYRLADWSVFSPIEDAVAEVPPSYTATSVKRPRSSTPGCSSPKRVLLDLALSPTEKASTTSTSSPKPPSSPTAYAPDLQAAITSAVETLLPAALQNTLPDLLPRLFTIPPTSPSSSPSPSASPPPPSNPNSSSKSNPPPDPDASPISSLRTLIAAHLTAHADAHLQRIFTHTLSHATYLRNTADIEFLEILDEQKLDITMLKDDSIAELDRACTEKLEELREQAAEVVEELEDKAELVYVDVCERVEGLVGKEREGLARERRELERGRRELEEDRRRRDIMHDRGRRAASLPL